MTQRKAGSTKATDTLLISPASLTADISGVLPIANGGTNLGVVGAAQSVLRTNAAGTALEYWPATNIIRLSADNSPIAAAAPTTVVTVATLVQAAAVNEEWDIEWILHVANSIAADVFVIGISVSAGTIAGRFTVLGENGVPTTGAGVVKKIDQAVGTLTTATANAPGATGTIGLVTTIVVRAQVLLSVNPGNIQVGLRAGTNAAASSGTATVKARSQMIATRVA